MRQLDFFIAVFLLLQTGFAAACHNVGDFHVICHDDGIKTVYVERHGSSDRAQLNSDEDTMLCCSAIMAGESPTPDGLPLYTEQLPQERLTKTTPTRALRVATPPTRGPPVFSAL